MFADLLKTAEAELTALKADASAVEARIEAAFNLGAVHHALDTIKNSATALEEKLLAAFHLGKSAQ